MQKQIVEKITTLIPHSSADEYSSTDLVCFSHLRWDFVYQRPQHLLSRFARKRRVFYIEEPVFGAYPSPCLEIREPQDDLFVVVPQLPYDMLRDSVLVAQRQLVDKLFAEHNIDSFTLWYYTPMALAFSDHLKSELVVYDCMDELSAFRYAPPELILFEKKLLEMADLVFTGGPSLYEAKKDSHPNVHLFPSSIDYHHFHRARLIRCDPEDQMQIPHPRIGFFGVIDERTDLELLNSVARERPDWHWVMVGPTVKIAADFLPQRDNIHYLGMKDYRELPSYLAGWDVAMLPFALNESTRFISPTKTPEYLAAGKPVVSTPIRDVARPYGERGLVKIAANAEEFIAHIEEALRDQADKTKEEKRLQRVDQFLKTTSWDSTWRRMAALEIGELEKCVDWGELESPRSEARLQPQTGLL